MFKLKDGLLAMKVWLVVVVGMVLSLSIIMGYLVAGHIARGAYFAGIAEACLFLLLIGWGFVIFITGLEEPWN